MLTTQREAIVAALRRVKPGLEGTAFEIELSWALWDIRVEKHRIMWRTFELGRELFRALAEAQNWRCCYCGEHVDEQPTRYARYGTIEHVVPLSLRGPDHPDNMAIACKKCNSDQLNL